MKAAPRYATEAALCADFIAEAERTGRWTCYPETEGWDILVVRKSDGFQVGIQAKLKFNAQVVEQALEWSGWSVASPGPDCRAILISDGRGAFSEAVCAYIGLTIIQLRERSYGFSAGEGHIDIRPELPKESKHFLTASRWHEWAPSQRHPLPDYVPDCVAGSAAPLQLTAWKIGAMKLAIILEDRPLTRLDFKHVGIDHRRWLASGTGWLQRAEDGTGYVAGPRLPDFKRQHPRNYDEIKADAAKWMPPAPPLLKPLQEVLV